MGETEQPGMEGLTRKGGNLRPDRAAVRNRTSGTGTVERIANQGMAKMGEMNPDLMGSTRG